MLVVLRCKYFFRTDLLSFLYHEANARTELSVSPYRCSFPPALERAQQPTTAGTNLGARRCAAGAWAPSKSAIS
eukprot:1570871-Rhodomonas_salina.1